VQRGDHVTAKALHERLLGLWNALSAENLPANVKYALACEHLLCLLQQLKRD
jgi:4-hydroxy-tetrahydrodipicolinate synthase